MGRAQQQKQMLMMRSQQEKAQSHLTIDQYATYGNMYVDDQTLAEVAYLQAESAQHRQILEQQASALSLEYNQRKAQEDMMMRQYQIQRQYYDNSQKLYGMQSEVQRGVIPQGLFGGSMAQPGTVLYDSAKQGAGMVPGASMVTGATQKMTGMVPGQSMVAGGQEPLANVAANKVGATLGPGMASSMVTQGTATGVESTQGVMNATMGAVGRTMGGARDCKASQRFSMMHAQASGLVCTSCAWRFD